MGTNRKIQNNNIELFFKIVNADKINDMSITELSILVMGYFDLLEAFLEKMPFLSHKDLQEKRQETIVIINSSDSKKVGQVKDVFAQLQQNIRKQVEDVMKNVGKGEESARTIVTSRAGRQEVYADLKKDEFTSIFIPDKISDKLNADSELQLLDSVMEIIFVKYNKKPSKLMKCQKDRCNNIFFRFSESSKYCSTKCSNAAGQKAFRKRSSSNNR